jgi:hypothetical protein
MAFVLEVMDLNSLCDPEHISTKAKKRWKSCHSGMLLPSGSDDELRAGGIPGANPSGPPGVAVPEVHRVAGAEGAAP